MVYILNIRWRNGGEDWHVFLDVNLADSFVRDVCEQIQKESSENYNFADLSELIEETVNCSGHDIHYVSVLPQKSR